MKVLVAYDKFKDSISAEEAGEITAGVIRKLHPEWEVSLAPLSDGGDGFCRILTEARGGTVDTVEVTGPRFGRTQAEIGTVDLENLDSDLRNRLEVPATGRIAVIEMAQASGLHLLSPSERDLWQTSSYGTGEMIERARRGNCRAILLGIGGSATSDLGLGALEALGLRATTAQGESLRRLTPSRSVEIASFSGKLPDDIPPLRIACDVQNPLLGENGAAAVYGPQKGLREEDFTRLDELSGRLANLLCDYAGTPRNRQNEPGSGAAGGIAFGFRAALQSKLVPGFELVVGWLGLDTKVASADLIISGEGRFDKSSLQGKGPGTLIEMARAHETPIWIFAGQVDGDVKANLPRHFALSDCRQVTPKDLPIARALREARSLLAKEVKRKLRSVDANL